MNAVSFDRSDDIVFVAPERFDHTTVGRLRSALECLAEGPADVVIDLSQARSLDSSGIGAMVFLFKRLTARGRSLVIAGASGEPARLLAALRVDRILPSRDRVALPTQQPVAADLGWAA